MLRATPKFKADQLCPSGTEDTRHRVDQYTLAMRLTGQCAIEWDYTGTVGAISAVQLGRPNKDRDSCAVRSGQNCASAIEQSNG